MILEIINKYRGFFDQNHIWFPVQNQVWGEHSEDEEKIWAELSKAIPDLDGAKQGHPMDEGDMSYIYYDYSVIKIIKKELGLKDKEIAEFFGYNNKASYANSSGKVKIENGIIALVEHMKSQGWSKPKSI